MTNEQIWKAYREGNNNGEGFSPLGYEEGDGPERDLSDLEEELQAIFRYFVDNTIAVYEDKDGQLIGVGDANGPWAVKLS